MQRIMVVDNDGLTAFSNTESRETLKPIATLLNALLNGGVGVGVNGVEFDGEHGPYEVSIVDG